MWFCSFIESSRCLWVFFSKSSSEDDVLSLSSSLTCLQHESNHWSIYHKRITLYWLQTLHYILQTLHYRLQTLHYTQCIHRRQVRASGTRCLSSHLSFSFCLHLPLLPGISPHNAKFLYSMSIDMPHKLFYSMSIDMPTKCSMWKWETRGRESRSCKGIMRISHLSIRL